MKIADEHHRGNRADPIKMTRRDAILGAGSAHADDFLRAQIRRNKRQPADPRRNRPAGKKEVGARPDRPPEPKPDAQYEHQVHRHDEPVDGRKMHDSASLICRRESPTATACDRPESANGTIQSKNGLSA